MSSFAAKYKRKGGEPSEMRSERAKRRSVDWKQSREKTVGQHRRLNANVAADISSTENVAELSAIVEHPPSSKATNATGKSEGGNKRREQLAKWKAEKDAKKLAVADENAKKKPFRVCHVDLDAVKAALIPLPPAPKSKAAAAVAAHPSHSVAKPAVAAYPSHSVAKLEVEHEVKSSKTKKSTQTGPVTQPARQTRAAAAAMKTTTGIVSGTHHAENQAVSTNVKRGGTSGKEQAVPSTGNATVSSRTRSTVTKAAAGTATTTKTSLVSAVIGPAASLKSTKSASDKDVQVVTHTDAHQTNESGDTGSRQTRAKRGASANLKKESMQNTPQSNALPITLPSSDEELPGVTKHRGDAVTGRIEDFQPPSGFVSFAPLDHTFAAPAGLSSFNLNPISPLSVSSIFGRGMIGTTRECTATDPAAKTVATPSKSSSWAGSSNEVAPTGTRSKKSSFKKYSTPLAERYTSPDDGLLGRLPSVSIITTDSAIPTGRPTDKKTGPSINKAAEPIMCLTKHVKIATPAPLLEVIDSGVRFMSPAARDRHSSVSTHLTSGSNSKKRYPATPVPTSGKERMPTQNSSHSGSKARKRYPSTPVPSSADGHNMRKRYPTTPITRVTSAVPVSEHSDDEVDMDNGELKREPMTIKSNATPTKSWIAMEQSSAQQLSRRRSTRLVDKSDADKQLPPAIFAALLQKEAAASDQEEEAGSPANKTKFGGRRNELRRSASREAKVLLTPDQLPTPKGMKRKTSVLDSLHRVSFVQGKATPQKASDNSYTDACSPSVPAVPCSPIIGKRRSVSSATASLTRTPKSRDVGFIFKSGEKKLDVDTSRSMKSAIKGSARAQNLRRSMPGDGLVLCTPPTARDSKVESVVTTGFNATESFEVINDSVTKPDNDVIVSRIDDVLTSFTAEIADEVGEKIKGATGIGVYCDVGQRGRAVAGPSCDNGTMLVSVDSASEKSIYSSIELERDKTEDILEASSLKIADATDIESGIEEKRIKRTCATAADDCVFRTPSVPAPKSARRHTSVGVLSSAKKNRTPRGVRNSLILRNLSPEEGVKVLENSPMIEMHRRIRKITSSDDESMVEEVEDDVLLHNEKVDGTIKNADNISKTNDSEALLQGDTDAVRTQTAVHYRTLVQADVTRITSRNDAWRETLASSSNIPDEVEGQIRSAIGQADWIIAKRFKQFFGCIDNCEFQNGDKLVKPEDLHEYCNILYKPQVADIDDQFLKLEKLQAAGWVEECSSKESELEAPAVQRRKVQKKPVAMKSQSNSKFAAFRQQRIQSLKQQTSTGTGADTVSEPDAMADSSLGKVQAMVKPVLIVSPDRETKTFDGVFFTVCSPVPKSLTPASTGYLADCASSKHASETFDNTDTVTSSLAASTVSTANLGVEASNELAENTEKSDEPVLHMHSRGLRGRSLASTGDVVITPKVGRSLRQEVLQRNTRKSLGPLLANSVTSSIVSKSMIPIPSVNSQGLRKSLTGSGASSKSSSPSLLQTIITQPAVICPSRGRKSCSSASCDGSEKISPRGQLRSILHSATGSEENINAVTGSAEKEIVGLSNKKSGTKRKGGVRKSVCFTDTMLTIPIGLDDKYLTQSVVQMTPDGDENLLPLTPANDKSMFDLANSSDNVFLGVPAFNHTTQSELDEDEEEEPLISGFPRLKIHAQFTPAKNKNQRRVSGFTPTQDVTPIKSSRRLSSIVDEDGLSGHLIQFSPLAAMPVNAAKLTNLSPLVPIISQANGVVSADSATAVKTTNMSRRSTRRSIKPNLLSD